MSERLEMRVSVQLLERLDAVRGEVPRGTFIKGVLEQALSRESRGTGGSPRSVQPSSVAAPVRAHETPTEIADVDLPDPVEESAPAVTDVPGVVKASELQPPWKCSSCSHRAFVMGLCPKHGKPLSFSP